MLTGLGLFAIPGFGVLFGAGAVIGAFAGFDAGIIAGGLSTILVELAIKEESVKF